MQHLTRPLIQGAQQRSRQCWYRLRRPCISNSRAGIERKSVESSLFVFILWRVHLGCIIALTGVTDWITDGVTVVKLSNGHRLLGDITGSGCMVHHHFSYFSTSWTHVQVGTAVATFCGAMSMAAKSQPVDRSNGLVDGDMFVATVAGRVPLTLFHVHNLSTIFRLLAVTIASEAAGSRSDVQGPGTFLDAFIDELSKLTPTDLHDKAKFEIV